MAKENIESLCQKAQQALAQKQNDEAMQFYQHALGLRADNPDVHYGLATVHFLQGDLHKAAHHFKEVTRLDPLRAGAYINLGAVYNRLDWLDEAIPVLRRGIQLDMNRAEGYYNLGLVYRRKGQPEMSIQAYREAVRINPRMPDGHYNLANLLVEKQQFGQAIAHYKQALELRPSWEKAERGLEQAEAALEQEQEAIAHQAPAGSRVVVSPPSAVGMAHLVAPGPANIDPEITIDPGRHAELLRTLHKATIDSESQGRNFLKVMEAEIEPAIKELSTVLLYPHVSASDLDQSVRKFEHAIVNMRTIQEALQTSMERVRVLGEKILTT